jgi:hypothetical protein
MSVFFIRDTYTGLFKMLPVDPDSQKIYIK